MSLVCSAAGVAGVPARRPEDHRQRAERVAVDVEVGARRHRRHRVERRRRRRGVHADARARLVHHRVDQGRRVAEHADVAGGCPAPPGAAQRRRQPRRQHPLVHVGEAVRADARLVTGQHERRQRLAAHRVRVRGLQRIRHAQQHHARLRRPAVPANLEPPGRARREQLQRQAVGQRAAQHRREPAVGIEQDRLRLGPQGGAPFAVRVDPQRHHRRPGLHRAFGRPHRAGKPHQPRRRLRRHRCRNQDYQQSHERQLGPHGGLQRAIPTVPTHPCAP